MGLERIIVSENGRHFVTENGAPFFWLADTAWELFHRLSLEEARYYLQERAAQGFTVVQAVVLAELDGIDSPNANGDMPLYDRDPERPNEAYFQHIDCILAEAAQQGLYIALLPTWGDKVSKRYDWAVGPEIFHAQNAFLYGRWLAARCREASNIFWILGGDRNPDEREISIWSAMAKGILQADPAAVMTFHPQPFDGNSSSAWFHNLEWLSFNMLQTGHNKYTPVAEMITADYTRRPIKPVLNGEPTYEAHPLSFKPSEGYASEADIRRDAYLSVFAGACGHTYGCHSVWQFYAVGREGVNHPILEWQKALELAGASQMKHLRNLMLSHSPLKRIPGKDLLANLGMNEIKDCIIATRADDGSYGYVYTATGKRVVVNTGVMAGHSLRAYWMSPRDGTTTLPMVLEKKEPMEFIPPYSGEGCDWVLVLEAVG